MGGNNEYRTTKFHLLTCLFETAVYEVRILHKFSFFILS